MAVKILIHRKVKPGKEKELSQAVRNLRSKIVHAGGYISGETLRSIENPSLYLVISTWRSLEDWKHWANSPDRKAFLEQTNPMLEEPAQITSYEYESPSVDVNEILTSLASSVQDE
jgi:heme-degrading monooxygenase HmoA